MRRALVLWSPNWSVTASYRDDSLPEVVPGVPVAVLHKGLVTESSPEAREAGVKRGMRRRDAHLMCPALVLVAGNESVIVRLSTGY